MPSFYPSLFAAPQLSIGTIITELTPHVAGFHYDIMDFHFVKNLTGSIEELREIQALTKAPVWVHAMVMEPYTLLAQIMLSPGDIFSWHIERHTAPEIIKQVRSSGALASLAINPNTPLGEIMPFLDQVDQILIMGVEPGYSGQELLPSTIERIAHLARVRAEHNHTFKIGIDGGVTEENLSWLIAAGTDDIVLGSILFSVSQENRVTQITQLKNLAGELS